MVLGDVCKVEMDNVEPLNLHVVYPRCFEDSYITPDVKLEIGPLASWTPSERKPISCLVGELEPQLELATYYYDIYRMYKAGVFETARKDPDLLKDIVDFTAKFHPRSWAHFELCKPGTMLLQPSEHALPIMRADYQAMRQMIYGDYPSFDELLETLKELESDVNSLAA